MSVSRGSESGTGRPGARAGIRFYEQQLESSEEGSPEKQRALLGLADALLDLPKLDALHSAESALEAVDRALATGLEIEERARALRLRSEALMFLGRREESLVALEQAVELYRELSSQSPATFLANLAANLNNLGNRFGALGRHEEALAVTEESVRIYRRLSSSRPAAYLPGLARTSDSGRLRGRLRESLSES